jgi:DNA-directed RNA polymerase specialized sigma24 family protein
MRRFGVRPADVEDATQDALTEAWQGLSALPLGQDDARREMLRLAGKVAQRWRREATRLVCVGEWEARDTRNVEEWIAARMLWLEALSRLDEGSRKLLIAYQIDGHTYAEIGAEMREKDDTIRKRVNVADKKLREELDKLLGNDKDRNASSAAMGVGFALDPFDRAVFRAILDVEEEFGLGPPPASAVRPKVSTKPWRWQYFPMGILAVALFLVPGQGSRTEALYAVKMGNIPLPSINVRAATQTPQEARSDTREPLPPKTATRGRGAVPGLTPKDAAIVENLLHDGSSHTP